MGVNLTSVAELLGLDHDDRPTLEPEELVVRLRRVLSTAMRLTQQIPNDRLADTIPNRDRSYHSLANHLVQIPAGFLEVVAGAPLDAERAGAEPARLLAIGELAQRSARIRADLTRWVDGFEPSAFSAEVAATPVETFAGPQTLHQVLERTTWHAAQHCRQLHAIVQGLGLEADDPLTDDDLAGLPLPTGVWDA